MKVHDTENESCPWNDPETFFHPMTRGLPCSCPDIIRTCESTDNGEHCQGIAKYTIKGDIVIGEHKCCEYCLFRWIKNSTGDITLTVRKLGLI